MNDGNAAIQLGTVDAFSYRATNEDSTGVGQSPNAIALTPNTMPVPQDEERMNDNSHGIGDESVDPNPWMDMTEPYHKDLVQGLYIGIFAIFGSLLRMLVAQFFGEECHNPGTVGWLASGSPLCVTSSGSVIEEGGIIFADLPANMIGSFVMGFFASCATLKLASVDGMNVAWLPATHSFQRMPILHKGITTGFCGSLTTFSGWNSSMVVLLFGTGSNRPTTWFSAIFGYIIGMESAIGSYVAGKSLARRIYRSVNPILMNETDAMTVRKAEGVWLNPELPDFERRFLPDLDMGYNGEKDYGEVVLGYRLEYLTQWRESTKNARRVNHTLLPALIAIEKAILIDRTMAVPMESQSIANANGWNISALREWARAKDMDHPRLPSISSQGSGFRFSLTAASLSGDSSGGIFQLWYPAALFGGLMIILLFLLFSLIKKDSFTITDRTMVYAMICAPPGAVLRWILSSYNGKLKVADWEWYPLGTFIANLFGSIVSITLIATEYRLNSDAISSFWVMGTIRALKVGFVGSLTTVSTFVAEVHGFIISNTDHAYPYMLTTLACCCSISCLIYGLVVNGHDRPAEEDAN